MPAAGQAPYPRDSCSQVAIALDARGMDTHVDTGKGDAALTLLADLLGAEVIAIGPVDSPLPVTGHCSRCGSVPYAREAVVTVCVR